MRILDEESVIQRPRLGTKASDQKTQNSTTAVMSASCTSNSIGYSEQTMAANGGIKVNHTIVLLALAAGAAITGRTMCAEPRMVQQCTPYAA